MLLLALPPILSAVLAISRKKLYSCSSLILLSALIAFASIPFPPYQVAAAPIDDSCNGLSNLCTVSVADTYFAMVHNAMAAVENGFSIAANHIQDPITEALDAGYRGLNVDICNCDGSLQLCHGNDMVGCGVGRVDPMQAFTEINNWIVANPNNVIMISLEINENAGGPISLEMIQQLLQQVPGGFIDRLYDHGPASVESSPASSSWPTLGELIETNQQVLFFYFKGPEGAGDHVPGLNYWEDFALATWWQWESVAELESTLLPDCPITQGGTSSSTGDFFMVEAFVTEKSLFGLQFQPSQEAAQQINTVEWAGKILDACYAAHGFPATVFSVDFWSEGNLPTLMEQRNALLVGSSSPVIPDSSESTPIEDDSWNSTVSPTSNATTDFCTFNTSAGDSVVLSYGESYGDALGTSCSNPEKFPCFCNPDLPGQIECPYCGFPSQDPETGAPILYCAKHNETIEYVDAGSVSKICTCQVPEDPLEDPISSCEHDDSSSSSSPTSASTSENPDLLAAPTMPPSPVFNPVQSSASSSDASETRIHPQGFRLKWIVAAASFLGSLSLL